MTENTIFIPPIHLRNLVVSSYVSEQGVVIPVIVSNSSFITRPVRFLHYGLNSILKFKNLSSYLVGSGLDRGEKIKGLLPVGGNRKNRKNKKKTKKNLFLVIPSSSRIAYSAQLREI